MLRNISLTVLIVCMGVTGVARATSINLTLTNFVSYSGNYPGINANLTGTTLAGWTYDDVANTVTAPGTFAALIKSPALPVNPLSNRTIFSNTINGLVISANGGAASGTSFTCTEGTWGAVGNIDVCGGYSFGGNSTNDSTYSYGPGILFGRNLLGDDTPLARPQVNLAYYDGFSLIGSLGPTVTFGNTNSNSNLAAATSGFSFQFASAVVPIPPAVWLFGSALGLMGVMRRRVSA